jgi:hypothetical protein
MRQIIVFCTVLLAIVWGCEPLTERKQPPPSLYQLSQSDLDLSGEQLAKGYCAACHLMPDPSVLDFCQIAACDLLNPIMLTAFPKLVC